MALINRPANNDHIPTIPPIGSNWKDFSLFHRGVSRKGFQSLPCNVSSGQLENQEDADREWLDTMTIDVADSEDAAKRRS
jgi:hypothetical protein